MLRRSLEAVVQLGVVHGDYKLDDYHLVGDRIMLIDFDSAYTSDGDAEFEAECGVNFVGRLWVWGLSIAGEHGVRHVMKALLAEFDILQNVSGYPRLEDVDRDAIDSLPRVAVMPHGGPACT